MGINKRLEVCKKCEYVQRQKLFITCGDFLVGNNIIHEVDGEIQQVHLCGCELRVKTKIKSAKCPLKKW
jgi:hypothetical protein